LIAIGVASRSANLECEVVILEGDGVVTGADEAAVVGDEVLAAVDNLDLENGGTLRSSPSELERKDEDPSDPSEISGGGWIDRSEMSSGVDMGVSK
jgi:hypothetical protein